MTQAVLNLLNNAIKYSRDVKRIDVRVEQRGESLAVEIADRGVGITRSEHRKIFEKFYRISTGMVHDTKGSGLGLAIVRHIVEAHRGETVTRDQLLDEVWGYDNFPLTRTVDNHIARLRQKIEENPSEPHHIITIHRIGYKFLG
jgi:signal transduction histidine kinase